MKSTILMAIIFALGPASFARGQFALDSLPKPGQWAKYGLTNKITNIDPSVPEQGGESSYFLRCLRDESNQVPACVWIEYESPSYFGGSTIAYKLLIPESEFRPGGDPSRNSIAAWVLVVPGPDSSAKLSEDWSDGNPKRMNVDIESMNRSLFIVPPDDAEQLMTDEVVANGQTFRCKGLVFSHECSEGDKIEHKYQIETRVSPDTPFGLVAADWARTTFEEGKEKFTIKIKTVLLSSGEDAVSSIPDIK